MADLKQPPMDGSAGPLVRCCEGKNKNKLYAINDPCEGEKMRLITENGECECVECTGSLEEPNGSCQKLGLSSCYVCEDGKCVKGPLCCSNTPGKKSAGCYKTEEEVQDDVDCCVNEYIYVEFTASALTNVRGTYDSEKKKRKCTSTKSETRRFFTSRVDCETYTVESEKRNGEINSKNVTCGCPKGKYTYSVETLWVTSPNGAKRPARSFCGSSWAIRGLVNLAGPIYGQEFGGGCWWYASCGYNDVKWTVGTTGSGGDSYVSCVKNRSAFSQANEYPSCTGTQEYYDALPEYAKPSNINPENNTCACTGPTYAGMELNDEWRNYCGICAGKLSWFKGDYGCYYSG